MSNYKKGEPEQEGNSNSSKGPKCNRLAVEKSPYLLQHAENPVHWYPWGEEAFEKARKLDRPVFLSIGYSTCHWCHVMAHESFEDPAVAELMNKVFVSIKVDREERPDIDDIYMTVCQMFTGSGGWPLTIIMTPEKEPFFAGTYLPKEDRFGRPGMLTLIPRIKDLWNTRRDEIAVSAENTVAALKDMGTVAAGEKLGADIFDKAYEEIAETFDEEYGGFGSRPKFPTAHKLRFLLRYWRRTGAEEALKMVEKTFQAMLYGGIFDQIGYGFHRYSTDRTWLLPHFEKMLYDQAELAVVYTEAYQATREDEYREAAGRILQYVLRDMTSPEGGFYSAEDADSEGEEGRFYIWATDEIRNVLNSDEADFATEAFNIREGGNFRDEATGKKTGGNILYFGKSKENSAKVLGIEVEEFERRLGVVRKKLLKARGSRVRPARDDKILADWNGLMIGAFAKAGGTFGNVDLTAAAAKAADFIIEQMEDAGGRLYHRYREGEASIQGFIDDYAFMISGLIELYESTFDLKYVKKAIQYCEIALKNLWDDESGGFFTSPDYAEKTLVRKKQIYDGAIPSGNSVMMLNLVRLSRFTGRADLEEKAAKLQKAFAGSIGLSPSSYTGFLSGLDFSVGPTYETVVVGEPGQAETNEILDALRGHYLPNMVTIFKPAGSKTKEGYLNELEEIAGFTKDLKNEAEKTTVYICEDFKCALPASGLDQISKLLNIE